MTWRNISRDNAIQYQFFGSNSARYDINLIKSYLLPLLVRERDVKPIVIRKANQSIPFKIANIQFFDILHFPGGANDVGSFLKGYKTSETKRLFPYEWLNHPDKLNGKELPPYKAFHNKLRNRIPLEKKYLDYEKMIGSGLTTESVLFKMRLSEIPPTGAENYSYMHKVWENEKMQSIKDL